MDDMLPDVNTNFNNLIAEFEIPIDLRHDIVYCQRSIRLYMHALQNLLTNRWDSKMLQQLKKCIIEIESAILDISNEQKLTIVCLRMKLSEYYKELQKNNVKVDTDFGNRYISEVLKECINDEDFDCRPINVKSRLNETELREKYAISNLLNQEAVNEGNSNRVVNAGESLLISKQKDTESNDGNTAVHENNLVKTLKNLDINKTDQTNEPTLSFTSPAINRSRLNLIEALKKAKSFRNRKTKVRGKMSKKGSSLSISSSSSSSSSSSVSSASSSSPPVPAPKTRSDTSASASDEPTIPSQLTQEEFLKMFDLYKWEYLSYIGQRRSMRRRRTVKSNEKSDFHYYKSFETVEASKIEKEKKKKLWTATATTSGTRGRKRKVEPVAECSKSKKEKTEKPEQIKIVCNECSEEQSRIPLCQCEKCEAFFHLSCHSENISKVSNKQREKFCPTCFPQLTSSIPGFRMRYGKTLPNKKQKKSR